MIQSFAHKGLKKLFEDGMRRYVNANHVETLKDILDHLDAASTSDDMFYPGSGCHLLQPKQEGRWAVKVSENWRVTFRFENGDAYEVNYEDYH